MSLRFKWAGNKKCVKEREREELVFYGREKGVPPPKLGGDGTTCVSRMGTCKRDKRKKGKCGIRLLLCRKEITRIL